VKAPREGADDTLVALFRSLAASHADAASPARTPAQEKLVRAALEVFAETGFEGATTRAIAERAGVAEKTLFHHFGSKAGLFTEAVYPLLVELLGPRLFASLREVIAKAGGTFEQRLRAVAENRLAATTREPWLLKFLLQEVLLRPSFRAPFLAYWKAHLLPPMGAAIEAAMARGEVRAMPPGRFLRMFVSLVVGYAVTRNVLLPDLAWDDDEELAATVDVFLHGVAARPRDAADGGSR
jgi:AcrR family transcriptional regulator